MSDQTDPVAVTFKAGLDHYGWMRDPVDHVLDKALPDDPSPVHAVVGLAAGAPGNPFSSMRRLSVGEESGRDPIFLERFDYQDSLCGRAIKVVLGVAFDPADPDACDRCVAACRHGATGPPPGRSRRELEEAEHEAFGRAAQAHADTFDDLHPDEPVDGGRE